MTDSTARETAQRRVLTAFLVAVVSGCVAYVIRPQAEGIAYYSDFDHLYAASRAMLAGENPYTLVGPGKAIPWPYPLLYPLPALVVIVPFTIFPLGLANGLFYGLGGGVLAYVAQAAGRRVGGLLASASFFHAARLVQWSPWMTAAALAPLPLAWVLSAKPTIGAAMWFYRMDWRALLPALGVLAVAFVVQPDWVAEWLGVTFTGLHPVPLLQPGGFLLLLAALRWRRPEARLLLAISCVPQNMAIHETLPLFLIPRTQVEATLLVVLSWAAAVLLVPLKSGHTPFSFETGGEQFQLETLAVSAPLHVFLLFLPCLWMVLRRPNEGELPAWLAHWLPRGGATAAGG